MSKSFMHAALASAVLVTSAPALAQTSNTGASESRKMQSAATAQIPQCARPLGVLAIVEPLLPIQATRAKETGKA